MNKMTRLELLSYLYENGITVDGWGKGKAKTVDHLLREINSGEARITKIGHQLIREAESVVVHTYVDFRGKIFKLIEDKQLFRDGRIKPRGIEHAPAEKMRPGETTFEALRRAFHEELGFDEDEASRLIFDFKSKTVKGPVPSESFPGLITLYTLHEFETWLPLHLYNPQGYTEHQEDKTTYFVWQPCPNKVPV